MAAKSRRAAGAISRSGKASDAMPVKAQLSLECFESGCGAPLLFESLRLSASSNRPTSPKFIFIATDDADAVVQMTTLNEPRDVAEKSGI